MLLDVGGVWRQPFCFISFILWLRCDILGKKLPQCSTLFSPVFCPWRHSKDHEKIYHLVNIFSINVFIFCTSLCLHLDMQSCPEPLVLSIVMLQWITTCEGQLLALSNPYIFCNFLPSEPYILTQVGTLATKISPVVHLNILKVTCFMMEVAKIH